MVALVQRQRQVREEFRGFGLFLENISRDVVANVSTTTDVSQPVFRHIAPSSLSDGDRAVPGMGYLLSGAVGNMFVPFAGAWLRGAAMATATAKQPRCHHAETPHGLPRWVGGELAPQVSRIRR